VLASDDALQFDRPPLGLVALATKSSVMSAVGNDYAYDQVFSRELEALAGEHDVFIAISTSGNSPNILAAVDVAAKAKVRTMGFTGKMGGKLAALCPCLYVPSTRTERIQEGHILCGLVETIYFKDTKAAS
jgi:D-sedoheptulose 7-phosphate isomerase